MRIVARFAQASFALLPALMSAAAEPAFALAQQWERAQYDALAVQAFANEPGYICFALAQVN